MGDRFLQGKHFLFYFIAKRLRHARLSNLVSWIVLLSLRLHLKNRVIKTTYEIEPSCVWYVANSNNYNGAPPATEAGDHIPVRTAPDDRNPRAGSELMAWRRVSGKRGPQQPQRESITRLSHDRPAWLSPKRVPIWVLLILKITPEVGSA